jgi:hypothetical protein
LIAEHNQQYQKVFKKKLKPKHHHLIHYPSVLRRMGPASSFWAMRFEGKNHQSKIVSAVCRSRVNICKSLVMRNLFHMAHTLLTWKNKGFSDIRSVGPSYEVPELLGYCYKWVDWRGIMYKTNSVVCLSADDEPVFLRINYIQMCENGVMFLATKFETLQYCMHHAAYIVSKETSSDYICLRPEEVSSPLTTIYKKMHLCGVCWYLSIGCVVRS